MGLISKNYTMVAGQIAVAAQVNSDFDTLYTLVNGNIENVNIKSNAAIAGTKINPDFGTQAMFDNANITFGRIGYATEIPDFLWDNTNQKLRIRSTLISDIGDTPDVGLRRASGATYDATPTALTSNENIGKIWFQPYGTNNDFNATGGSGISAQIYAKTAEVPSGTGRGGELRIQTTGIGAVEPTDRITIKSTGYIGIGTDSPSTNLEIEGGIKTSSIANLAGGAKLGAGSILTISSGSITITSSYHLVDTEASATIDDLTTIVCSNVGQIVVLGSANSTRDIVLKDGDGLRLAGGDFTLTDTDDTITLICWTTNKFSEVARSNNS